MTKRKRHNSSLDGVYTPAAKGIETLDTLIPDCIRYKVDRPHAIDLSIYPPNHSLPLPTLLPNEAGI